MIDVTGIRGVLRFEKRGKTVWLTFTSERVYLEPWLSSFFLGTDNLAYVHTQEGVPKAVVVSASLIQTCTSNVMHVQSFILLCRTVFVL